MQHSLSFRIADISQVGEARRASSALTTALGFSETKRGEVALIVTEAANNILKHASRGELLLRTLETEGIAGLEILALDKGPGIANIGQCLQDGYSTAGTLGNGLGAIARLSARLDIYSHRKEGTLLLAQVWAQPLPPTVKPASMEYGVVNRPMPGQEVCGDAWAIATYPDRQLFFLADGLGHGLEAHDAAMSAVRAFLKVSERRPKEILEAVHAALSGTRGAVAAVAELSHVRSEVTFAGIGNIAGLIVTPEQSKSMVSHNGIVGHKVYKIQEFQNPWRQEAVLILHSDGVGNRWRLEHYPGLCVQPAAVIAGVLYRDFQRENDDATILATKAPSVEGALP